MDGSDPNCHEGWAEKISIMIQGKEGGWRPCYNFQCMPFT